MIRIHAVKSSVMVYLTLYIDSGILFISSKLKCTFFMRHGCCPFKTECIYSHDMPPNHIHRRRRSTPRVIVFIYFFFKGNNVCYAVLPCYIEHQLVIFICFQDTADMFEDLGIDGLQIWSYIFALTLLDEDDDDFLDFLDD